MTESTTRAFLRCLLGPLQEFENAAQAVLAGRSIDAGEGVMLDWIGSLVGQPRDGASDDVYRRYLRARVAVNRSDTTANSLIRITRAALGGDDVAIALEPLPIDAIIVRLVGPVTDDTAAAILDLLLDGKAPQQRLVVEYSPAPVAQTFTLARAAYLDGAHLAGVLTLTVTDASALPGSGTLEIDTGLATAETVTYARTSATELALDAPTAYAHADRSACATQDPAVAFGAGYLAHTIA